MNYEYITAILEISRLEFSSGAMAPRRHNSEYKIRNNFLHDQFKSVRESYPSRPDPSKEK